MITVDYRVTTQEGTHFFVTVEATCLNAGWAKAANAARKLLLPLEKNFGTEIASIEFWEAHHPSGSEEHDAAVKSGW